MEKVKVTQDTLYEYILAHDVKMTRLAEMIHRAPEVVMSCFKHHNDWHGRPRRFNAEHIALINEALPRLADELRQRLLKFGSDQTYTNKWGNTYDPALVEPMKDLGKYLNIMSLTERLLGWSKGKKTAVISRPLSKIYGNISKADVVAINNEILAVAGVLSSYEVVAEKVSSSSGGDNAKPLKVRTKRKTMESSHESPKYEWNDTSLGLSERSALLRKRWPNGMLLFRVNGGYTAEGDDVRMVHDLLPDVHPYTNQESGMTTAYMSEEQMAQVLSKFIAQGRRVMITDMYKE